MKYTMPEIEEGKRLADKFFKQAEDFIAKRKAIHVFCNCDNQQPEEIKRGVYQCTNCLNDIDPADFAQDEPEPDFSESQDIIDVEAMNKGYEESRNESYEQDHDFGHI